MQGVSHLLPEDRQPFIDIFEKGGRTGEVDADGDSDVGEVVLGKEGWDDISLLLRCHLVAVDKFLACVTLADVGVVEQVCRLDF